MACENYTSSTPCGFCGLAITADVAAEVIAALGGRQHFPNDVCPTCATHALNVNTEIFVDAELRQNVMLVPVTSSTIKLAGWRATKGTTGVLVMQFVNGQRYRYVNVEHEWFTRFLAADSKGGFFAATVRAHPEQHPFTRIGAEPPPPPRKRQQKQGAE